MRGKVKEKNKATRKERQVHSGKHNMQRKKNQTNLAKLNMQWNMSLKVHLVEDLCQVTGTDMRKYGRTKARKTFK